MELNVVYSSDNNYAQHVGVSMLSLFENNKEFNCITIYLVEDNISVENKNKLVSISETYNRKIKFINFNQYKNSVKLNIGNSISINAYARLFITTMLNTDIEKVIYLDSDSIINNSLSDLWSININEYYVAGVCDTVSDNAKLKISMNVNQQYINSGMLLVNLKKWREERVEEKFKNFIEYYDGNVFHHDQGVINGVLKDSFLILPPKYNAMTTYFTMKREEIMEYYKLKDYYNESELKEAISNPIFIHFTPGFVNRPWVKGSKHPLKYLYVQYLDVSPWKGSKLSNDTRNKGEKIVAFMFEKLPFKTANSLRNLIFK